jgi:tetratricopeptide (TPR) repeat protein
LASQLQLAADLARGGRHAQAASLLEQIEVELAGDVALHHLDWARWWWVKSDLEAFCLDLQASLSSAEKACERLALGVDPEPRLVDGVRTRFGKALRMLGDYRGSERVFLKLVAAQAERDGAGAETTQLSRLELARCFMFQQRTDAALKIAREVKERLEGSFGRYNLATQWANDAIASIQFKQEDYEGAAETWQEVARDLLRLSSNGTDFALTARANVALALMYAGKYADAEFWARSSIELAAPGFASDSPRSQSIRFQLAFCLLEQGKAAEVDALLDSLDPVALKQAVQADDWGQMHHHRRPQCKLPASPHGC